MPEQRLPIVVMCQEQTEWCWAACAEAVLNAIGTAPLPQCQIVGAIQNDPACCSHPYAVNVSGSFIRAVGLGGVTARDIPATQAQFRFDLIRQQISRSLPVAALIKDKQLPLRHNVLIVGCDAQKESVLVCDPWGTIGTAVATWSMPFDTFRNNYGDQGWGVCTDIFVLQ